MICPACKAQVADDAKFCGTCGRSLAPEPPQPKAAEPQLSSMFTVDSEFGRVPKHAAEQLAPGAVFAGRYEIKRLLDSNAGADSYLAGDRVTSTDVALKLVRLDPRLGADGAQRFIREAIAARDIRHPNVAAVYDVAESGGQPYITSEVIEGVSLRDWNRRRLQSGKELGMSSISAIIFAILDAIMTIHIRKLITDLKPHKIMLLSDPEQPNPRIKLVDVGIPYLADAGDTAGTGFGANPYRAPEALTISGDALQPSSDIYSVSMVFYELLTGVPLAGHWQAPSADRKDVPKAIDELIQNGLSNAPRRRPQSAEDYKSQLQAALGPGVDPPKPPPTPPNPPKPPPPPPPPPGPGDVQTWKIPDFLVPILKTLNMPFMLIVIMFQNIISWIEILAFANQPLPLGAKKSARRRTIGALVFIVLVAAIGLGGWGVTTLMNSDGDDVFARNEDQPGPPPVTPDPGPVFNNPDPPPPPPPPSPYAAFNGYWTDDFGDTWTVAVDNLGRVQALATGGVYAGTQMAGAFSGRRFDFTVGNAYGAVNVSAAFDGQCHIKYQMLDPYGSGRMVDASLHVNHQPGAPCP